jgi:hypothetical protein
MQFSWHIIVSINLAFPTSALRINSFHNRAGDAQAASCPAVSIGNFDTANTLEGMQWIGSENNTRKPVLPFEHFAHGGGWDGLFVNPAKKFAFCMIAKNGCHSWGQVLCRATLNRDCGGAEVYKIGPQTFSPAKASQVFSDHTAIRAVFVRDPLERFLSAFLNKCKLHSDTGNCLPKTVGKSFAAAVHNSVNMGKPWKNTHWNHQSEHCELHKRLHEYNLISLMHPTMFTNYAMCTLSLGNLTKYASDAKGKQTFSAPVNPSLESNKHSSVLKKFYTPESARAVMQLYKADYDLFKLPKPAWIDSATGEWSEMSPSIVTPSMVKLPRGVLPAPNEDDIVTLAAKTGYTS